MRFSVHNQEFGRGPVEKKRFKSIAEAAKYIQDRWQGADYMDGDTAFHTDYCTYTCHGFTLLDLGKRTFKSVEGMSWCEWEWKDEFKPVKKVKPNDFETDY